MKRRLFLGLGALLLGGGVIGYQRIRNGGEVRPLTTDPDSAEFIYRDGWIEPV